jgi:hypothetical protein
MIDAGCQDGSGFREQLVPSRPEHSLRVREEGGASSPAGWRIEPAFHGGNRGSNPLGDANYIKNL